MRATDWLVVLGVVGGVVLGAVDRAAAQNADQGSRCVPLKGHCNLDFAFGQIDAPEEPFSLTGTCTLSAVGRVDVRGDGVAALTGQPTPGTLAGALSGTVVYVAANGDELRSTFSGTFVPDAVTSTTLVSANSETYSGGTGRFEGATGSTTVTGFTDLLTGAAGTGIDGAVCFGGSAGATP